MNIYLIGLIGLILPFLGTVFGSSLVFFFKDRIRSSIEKVFFGFAAGIMCAAAIWSLIIPAIDILNKNEKNVILNVIIGILFGISFLRIIEKITCKFQKSKNRKDIDMLTLAMTIHNIPEGITAGIAIISLLNTSFDISNSSMLAIAIGIAIQNIPDGVTVSLPLMAKGTAKNKAFKMGVLSGIVEPIAAIITIIFSKYIENLMPWLLSFSAGTMLIIIVEELIPESQKGEENKIGTLGMIVGIILMLILDNMM